MTQSQTVVARGLGDEVESVRVGVAVKGQQEGCGLALFRILTVVETHELTCVTKSQSSKYTHTHNDHSKTGEI